MTLVKVSAKMAASTKVRSSTAVVAFSVSWRYQIAYFAFSTSLVAHSVFLLQELLLMESENR